MEVDGASGGNLSPAYTNVGWGSADYGGWGDDILANIAVSPGQQLYITVGANGANAVDGASGTTAGGYGGINGDESGGTGGAGTSINNGTSSVLGGQGGGGGGASDIRTSGGTRLIVAFGGGGAGYSPCQYSLSVQGQGGGYSGTFASYNNTYGDSYVTSTGTDGDRNLGGGAATTSAGGAGVNVTADVSTPLCQSSIAGTAGTNKGGNGGTLYAKCSGACTTSYGGGGGGGGYYGGGGGCGGGGGSGSSYTAGPGVSGVTCGSCEGAPDGAFVAIFY